jgi:hypothetical protein
MLGAVRFPTKGLFIGRVQRYERAQAALEGSSTSAKSLLPCNEKRPRKDRMEVSPDTFQVGRLGKKPYLGHPCSSFSSCGICLQADVEHF